MSNRKKNALVMGMLTLFLSHAVLLSYAEEPQEKIDVRLVWKRAYADKLIPDGKTFPPPEIQAEIESESTSGVGKRFLINTLREQVAKHDRLVFFEGGEIMDVKEEGYPFVYFSPNGEYIGFGGGSKGVTEEEFAKSGQISGRLSQLILMTKHGELLWRKTLVRDWVNVLDNGEVVLGTCPLGATRCLPKTIYDQKGEAVFDFQKGQQLPARMDPGQSPVFAYWAGGSRSSTSVLWLFASGGKVSLKKDIEGFVGNNAILSDDKRYIFLNGRRGWPPTQRLVDRNGGLIHEYSFFSPAGWDFSSDGDFLVLQDRGRKLYFIECSTGRILWEISREGNLETFADVQVAAEGYLVLFRILRKKDITKWVTSSAAKLLNNKGELLWQETFPSDILGRGEVIMADNGSYFIVNTENSLYCYAIGQ